jgi:hypothetical protein
MTSISANVLPDQQTARRLQPELQHHWHPGKFHHKSLHDSKIIYLQTGIKIKTSQRTWKKLKGKLNINLDLQISWKSAMKNVIAAKVLKTAIDAKEMEN